MSEARPLRARRMLHRLELRGPHDLEPRAVSEYQKERFEALRRIGVPGPGACRKISTVEVCDSIEVAGPQRHVFDSNHGCHGGMSSKIVSPGGITAHAGRLRVKIAIVGWNANGSSSEPPSILETSAISPF